MKQPNYRWNEIPAVALLPTLWMYESAIEGAASDNLIQWVRSVIYDRCSLANILLLPTSSTESRGYSRSEQPLFTSLLSLFLSLSVFPAPQQTTLDFRLHHSITECPEKCPAHTKGPQSPQPLEATLGLLAQGIYIVQPVHFLLYYEHLSICMFLFSQF